MKLVTHLKLSSKLLFSFLLVAAIAVIVGYVGLTSTRKVATASEEMYSGAFVSVREVAAARGAFLDARIRSRSSVTVPTNEERRQEYDAFRADVQRADEHLGRCLQTSLSENEKAVVSKLQSEVAEYRRQVEPAFPLAISMKDREAEAALNGSKSISAEATADFQQLLDINDQFAQSKQQSNKAMASAASTTILCFAVLGVVVALVLGWLLTRLIAAPVRELQSCAAKLASGDVDVEIQNGSQDEVGMLAQSVRELAALIKTRAQAAERIAAGDLAVEIKAASSRDILAASLQSVVDTLNKLMRQMATMSECHDAGDIDAVIDHTQFRGAYSQVASGINKMVAGHITVKKKAMACIAEFGRGNFEAPLEQFPGKKAFINETIEQVRGNLKSLISDTQALSTAAIHGRLGVRANAERHHGDFRKIVQGINYTLDTVVGKFDAIPKPIQFIDGQFKIQYMNRAGLELLRETKDSIIGKRCGYNTSACGTSQCTCDQAMKIDSLARIEAGAEIHGNRYDFACCAVPLKDSDGHTIGAFELLDDESMTKATIRKAEKVAEYQAREAKKLSASLLQFAEGDLGISVHVDSGDGDTTDARKAYEDIGAAVRKSATSVRSAVVAIAHTTNQLLESAHALNKVSQQMTASADETATQANVVSAASEQVSRNVQTVASGADEMGATIKEIAKNTAEATRVATTRGANRRTTNGTIAQARREQRRDRQGHQGHHLDRPADQPAGAERDHRSGARRRSRQRLRRRRQRGQGARQGNRQGDRGHQPQDRGDSDRHRRGRIGDRPDRQASSTRSTTSRTPSPARSKNKAPPPTRSAATWRKPPRAASISPTT